MVLNRFTVSGVHRSQHGRILVGETVSPYTASGTAAHLGKYSGFGIAQVTGMDEEPTDPGAVFRDRSRGWGSRSAPPCSRVAVRVYAWGCIYECEADLPGNRGHRDQ